MQSTKWSLAVTITLTVNALTESCVTITLVLCKCKISLLFLLTASLQLQRKISIRLKLIIKGHPSHWQLRRWIQHHAAFCRKQPYFQHIKWLRQCMIRLYPTVKWIISALRGHLWAINPFSTPNNLMEQSWVKANSKTKNCDRISIASLWTPHRKISTLLYHLQELAKLLITD